MKDRILKYLRETSDYVSGQKLCQEFNVSRTAIWKVINQLKEEGYEIESVKNKGYRLKQVPDLVTAEEISSLIDTKWAGHPVIYKEEMISTNLTAKQLAEQGAVHGTLVVAETQLGGRGRRGRIWHSPKGSGAWSSLLLRPDIAPEHASMLTIVAAMAAYDAICPYLEKCAIKWPNDLVADGKKVVGILTEMSAEVDNIQYVVVGIGVNVNTEVFPEDIEGVAASLHTLTGDYYKRSSIICDLWKAFEKYYAIFMETEDLSGLTQVYNSHLINRNQRVRIEKRGSEFEAEAIGMDQDGSLIVRKDDGTLEHIISGEVSVRGVLGYV